jgi:3D (Asp-Asp-Asp) domain-containing protein
MVSKGIVAADPRVLPLGTKIKLEAAGYSGTYIVRDTGGRIKGRRLDIWVPTLREARKFGKRKVTVTVLK